MGNQNQHQQREEESKLLVWMNVNKLSNKMSLVCNFGTHYRKVTPKNNTRRRWWWLLSLLMMMPSTGTSCGSLFAIRPRRVPLPTSINELRKCTNNIVGSNADGNIKEFIFLLFSLSLG